MEQAGKPPPHSEDIEVEFVESKPTSEGIAMKLVVSNVGDTPARVQMWPYVELSDGKKVGRSLLEGPVFADVDPGKKTLVWAAVKVTERQQDFISSCGVEDVTIERLKGDPSTAQIPGSRREVPSDARTAPSFDPKLAFRVQPGKSLGPVLVGMSDKEAIAVGAQAWGEEPVVNRTLGAVIHWRNVDVVANASGPRGGTQKVFSIRTVNPRFKTSSGIGIGSTYAAAKKALGKPNDYLDVPGAGARAAWPSGVWVDIDTKGTIVGIGVGQ